MKKFGVYDEVLDKVVTSYDTKEEAADHVHDLFVDGYGSFRVVEEDDE